MKYYVYLDSLLTKPLVASATLAQLDNWWDSHPRYRERSRHAYAGRVFIVVEE